MLIVRKEAEEDMRAAFDWYEKAKRKPGKSVLSRG